MKAKLPIFLAALLLTPAIDLNAQTASNAASFLEIDGGARGAAMGGAFTAIADDASSVFYNPAGPALLSKPEVMLSHSQWLEGLWNEHLAYVHPVSAKLTIFTGVSGLAGPPLDKYEGYDGELLGTFVAFDGAVGLGAAVALTKSLYAGINIKAIYSQVDQERAFAYAGDFGLIETHGVLRMGFSMQNIGTKLKLYQESFDLPLISRGGAALHIADHFWLSGEGVRIGEENTYFAGGAEGEFKVTPEYTGSVRVGYKNGRSKNTGSGISAGVGFKSGDLSCDYAFSPFGDLGDTHRLTLNFKFGKERKGAAHSAPRIDPIKQPIIPDEVELLEPAKISTASNNVMKPADNYFAQKDYVNAGKSYSEVLKILPEDDERRVYAFERQGQISMKGKNIQKAKDFFLASIQTAKKLAVTNVSVVNAYLGLAYCFEKSENAAAALKNYEKALTLSDNEKTKTRIRKSIQRLKTNSVETGADDILIK